MYDYLNEHLIPHMDKLSRRVDRIETRFDAQPKINLTIEATDIDELIEQLQKLYSNFATKTNLNINVTLKGSNDDSLNP